MANMEDPNQTLADFDQICMYITFKHGPNPKNIFFFAWELCNKGIGQPVLCICAI